MERIFGEVENDATPNTFLFTRDNKLQESLCYTFLLFACIKYFSIVLFQNPYRFISV